MGTDWYCSSLERHQDLIMILMWMFSMPLAGFCCIFRLCCHRHTVRIWMVIHSNVSFWVWISMIFSTFTVCASEERHWKHKDLLIGMGIFFLMLSMLISLLSAVATDGLYPDCKLSQRQFLLFLSHLKAQDPDLMLTLPKRYRNRSGAWDRAKRRTDMSNHVDDLYVLQEVQPWMYKVNLYVAPLNDLAKFDMQAFLWRFGQENALDNDIGDLRNDFKLSGTIPAPPTPKPHGNLARLYGQGLSESYPNLSTEKTIRIHVSKDGSMSLLTDLALRFAWLLNVIGLSSIVLATLTHWKRRTRSLIIIKKFHARDLHLPDRIPQSPPPPSYNEALQQQTTVTCATTKETEETPPSYDSIAARDGSEIA